MKVSEIHIERYGVWRNLTLPLNKGGVSTFYGPNEAGKTTLMRFIRGVLYGFGPRTAESTETIVGRMPMLGSLQVDEQGTPHRVQRVAIGDSRGDVSLLDEETDRSAGEVLAELLHGVDEKVFEHVFAIGLREMQELGTLTDDEVAQYIYGLTLGPDARQLLDVWTRVQGLRTELIDPLQQRGGLVELYERYDRLTAELRALEHQKQNYQELAARRDALETEIADLKLRQIGIQDQLRGHLFLERAWGPWNRMLECERELDQLPVVVGFPEHGIERLDKLDAEIADRAEGRDALLTSARQLGQQRVRITLDPDLKKHAAAVQGCVDQRGWIVELLERVAQAEAQVAEARLEFESESEQLGADWPSGRLEASDTSATAHHRLAGTGRSLTAALARRASLKRARKSLASRVKQQRRALVARLADLQGESVADALVAAHGQLDELKELAELRLYEGELEDRQFGIEDHRRRVAPRVVLPRWVYVVLGVFCFSGVVLAGGGLVTGAIHSGIAGSIYAILAFTVGGLAWGLKTQFEGDARQQLAEVEEEAARNAAELEKTRDSIRKIVGSVPEILTTTAVNAVAAPLETTPAESQTVGDTASPQDAQQVPQNAAGGAEGDEAEYDDDEGGFDEGPVTRRRAVAKKASQLFASAVTRFQALRERHKQYVAKHHRAADTSPGRSASAYDPDQLEAKPELITELVLIRHATQRIAELEQLGHSQQQVQQLRRKLRKLRQKLQIVNREVATARHNWCELLAQFGLSQNLTVAQTLETWQLLVTVKEKQALLQAAEARLANVRDISSAYQQRIKELGHRIQAWDLDFSHPLPVLDAWEKRLAEFARQQKERRVLKLQIITKQREAREFQSLVDELKLQRNALLTQGGAADRDEFELRSRSISRRMDLEDQFEDATHELDKVAEEHADLALVEEDLQAFDGVKNKECIETLNLELDDLQQDQEQSFQQLGGVKHEMQELEDDRQASRLRYELAQLESKIHNAAEEWFALETATQIVDDMRWTFERTRQPATLMRASRFLTRLTCGKYRNVWTPLGKRHLRVDDDRDLSLPVECLSRGTREQLFLAVRLAVVQDLAKQGIVLPMVLDDVLVNFDQERTEAAVDLLLEFAEAGHQILFFTCHKHLAQTFESKGVTPISLPTRESLVTDEGTQRLAS